MFEDPSFFITIKKSSCLWFDSKLLIFNTRMAFLSIIGYIILVFYELYQHGINLHFVLSYGANIFAYIFYLMISFTYITQRKMMYDMEKYLKENFQSFSSRGKEVKKSIWRKMKIGLYASYIQMVFSLLSLVSLLPIQSDRTGILFIPMLVERANVSFTMEILHYVHFIPVHFSAFQVTYCYANVMLYFVLHLHFQFVLLLEGFRTLENGLDSSSYHDTIEQRLASLIRHYQVVNRFQLFIEDLFRRPMFFVVWFGLMDFMFVSYLLVEVDLGADILTVFMVWLSIIELALHFVVYGQIYANQRENLWEVLMNCQWFKWNNRNKRTYQMLLKHVDEERFIKAGGLIVFDSTFLIWFGRKTVSAVAFLSTIEEMNSSKTN